MENVTQKRLWLKAYQWKTGQSGNPNGRPKGKTLKEWVREYLFSLSDVDKAKFIAHISPDLAWKMAEGQPHQTTDITSAGKPIPIYSGVSITPKEDKISS
jgi:hypothetical protein